MRMVMVLYLNKTCLLGMRVFPQVDGPSISNLQSPFDRKRIELMRRIETDHICPNRRHSSNPPSIHRDLSFALPASKCSTLPRTGTRAARVFQTLKSRILRTIGSPQLGS